MRLHRFEVTFGKDMVLMVILLVLSKWEVFFDPKMENSGIMDSFFSLDKAALWIWVRLPQTSFSYTANTHCSSKPIYRIPGSLVFSECTSK